MLQSTYENEKCGDILLKYPFVPFVENTTPRKINLLWGAEYLDQETPNCTNNVQLGMSLNYAENHLKHHVDQRTLEHRRLPENFNVRADVCPA
jgi:hypothetical protein